MREMPFTHAHWWNHSALVWIYALLQTTELRNHQARWWGKTQNALEISSNNSFQKTIKTDKALCWFISSLKILSSISVLNCHCFEYFWSFMSFFLQKNATYIYCLYIYCGNVNVRNCYKLDWFELTWLESCEACRLVSVNKAFLFEINKEASFSQSE